MDFSSQKFREIVVQLLYSFAVGGEPESECIAFLMQALTVSKKNVRSALEKAHIIWAVHEQLDHCMSQISQDYAFERIKQVEKSVLRLALYELLIEKTLNKKIIIAEAHRLTRKFGTKEGASFVNALIDCEDLPNIYDALPTVSTPEAKTS